MKRILALLAFAFIANWPMAAHTERLHGAYQSLPHNTPILIQFRVEPKHRKTFSPIGQLKKGAILSFRVVRQVGNDSIQLHICTSKPGTCNSAARAHVWKMADYASGSEIRWEIKNSGRYYLWSRVGGGGPANEIVYSKDLASATLIRFRSGLEIEARLLNQR